jgi:hypothetical protein
MIIIDNDNNIVTISDKRSGISIVDVPGNNT